MAQPASKLDPLLKQVDDIRLFLDAEKMPMFLASLSGHEGASASWDEALGGDWKKFVGAAKSMGAKSIYLNWERFQEAQFIDALATIEAGFVNSSGMDVEAKDVEKLPATCGPKEITAQSNQSNKRYPLRGVELERADRVAE